MYILIAALIITNIVFVFLLLLLLALGIFNGKEELLLQDTISHIIAYNNQVSKDIGKILQIVKEIKNGHGNNN